MPLAPAGAVQIHYETLGAPEDPALLLVAGLGAQLIIWHDELCHSFVDRGFFVIRFDNRDCGLSTVLSDGDAYTVSDMAADAVAVLDALQIDAAHVVGHSLGGMIAQTMAIEHPDRVLTLTSISSTTGNPDFGQPTAEALEGIAREAATDVEVAIESDVAARRIWASPSWFDEEETRAYFRHAHERSFTPGSSLRQLMAIAESPDREPQLRELTVPTLVIHGTLDPLVPSDGGTRTADVVPGAELLLVEGMGHDLPVQVWQQVISAITALAARAAS
jgi:pimeloyl-ACP methyl ester carboxylesterase